MTEFRLPLNGELGQFLKRARKAQRLTLWELAELSGVSESAICRIENNLRTANVLTAGKLEEALKEINKSCSRCGGKLFIEPNIVTGRPEVWCLQCGDRRDLAGKALLKFRIIKRQTATLRV